MEKLISSKKILDYIDQHQVGNPPYIADYHKLRRFIVSLPSEISKEEIIQQQKKSHQVAAVRNKSQSDEAVYDFARKIATVLKESRSSTALFYLQQAYPDDINAPSDQPTMDEILDNIILITSIH